MHPTPAGEPVTEKPGQGCVVDNGSLKSHKLSRTVSSITSSPVFCEAGIQHQHAAAVSQHNCSDLHIQDRWDPLTIAVLPSHSIVGMEPGTKYIPVRKTPAGQREHDSGRGVQNCEKQMQLDAVFNLIQA